MIDCYHSVVGKGAINGDRRGTLEVDKLGKLESREKDLILLVTERRDILA